MTGQSSWLACGLTCVAAVLISSNGPTLAAEPAEAEDQNAGILAAFRQKLDAPAQFNLLDTPLDQVVEAINVEHGLGLELDRKGLEEAGIPPNVLIDLSVAGVRLQSVLQIMLEGQFGREPVVIAGRKGTVARFGGLATVVRDKKLVITSRKRADSLEWREYSLADFDRPDTDRVVEMVISLTSGAWDKQKPLPADGPQGALESPALGVADGKLRVVQTQAVHLEIEELLRELRQVLKMQRGGEPRLQNQAEMGKGRPRSNYEAIAMRLAADSKLRCADTSLVEVCEALQDEHEVPILFNDGALENAGVDRRMPVSVDLKGVPLRTLLWHLLDPWGLVAIRRHEVLQITTQEVADQQLERQMYDIRDLIGPEGKDLASVEQAARLAVAPGAWKEKGGKGKLCTFHGFLFVWQTYPNHWEIASLIAQLRMTNMAPPIAAPSVSPATADAEATMAVAHEAMFVTIPLQEAIKSCGEIWGLPVRLDLRALQEVGKSEKDPVSLSKAKRSFPDTMNALLRPAPGDRQKERLSWSLHEGLVVVSTSERTKAWRAWRVYDVRDREPATVKAAVGETPAVSLKGVMVVRQTPEEHRKLALAFGKLRAK